MAKHTHCAIITMNKIICPQFEFSAEKNHQLINERDICFEEVIAALSDGRLLETLSHPDQAKYPNQRIYIVNINEYVYMIPFVQKDEYTLFLKTIIPTRKLTKKYLGGRDE